MKAQQQQQARDLYFKTTLSKTEIAEHLSVSRRTVYQWSVDGDWEKLRTSARNMPSILAEKCYYLIGHFTDHLLSKDSCYQSVTKADADILHKLVNTVSKLKQGSSTISENMETFTVFLEGLQQRDAALAEALIPHADAFISGRAAVDPAATMLSGFTAQGLKPFSEKDILEKLQDEKDAADILQEMNAKSTAQQDAIVPPMQPGGMPPLAEACATDFLSTADLAIAPGDLTAPDDIKNWKTTFWQNREKEKAQKLAARKKVA